MGSFLKRLEIHVTTISVTPTMTEILVKIMVELLSVLALATKQIKKGRFSKCSVTCILLVIHCATEKFTKKFLGEKEIEDALHRLNRLIEDEI